MEPQPQKTIKRRRSKSLPEKVSRELGRRIYELTKKGRRLIDDKTGESILNSKGEQAYAPMSSADLAQIQVWLNRQPAGKEKSEIEMTLDDLRNNAINDGNTPPKTFKLDEG